MTCDKDAYINQKKEERGFWLQGREEFFEIFRRELDKREPSPALIEAVKIIAGKDKEIEELRLSNQEYREIITRMQNDSIKVLHLSYEIAKEIRDIVNSNESAEISRVKNQLKVEHDGIQVVAVHDMTTGSSCGNSRSNTDCTTPGG